MTGYDENMTDYRQAVVSSARALDLIDPSGELLPLDSLALLDLVESLEQATQLLIPTASLRGQQFASVDAIASLLAQLAQNGAAPRADA